MLKGINLLLMHIDHLPMGTKLLTMGKGNQIFELLKYLGHSVRLCEAILDVFQCSEAEKGSNKYVRRQEKVLFEVVRTETLHQLSRRKTFLWRVNTYLFTTLTPYFPVARYSLFTTKNHRRFKLSFSIRGLPGRVARVQRTWAGYSLHAGSLQPVLTVVGPEVFYEDGRGQRADETVFEVAYLSRTHPAQG